MKKLIVSVAMAVLCCSASADDSFFEIPDFWTMLVEQFSESVGISGESADKDGSVSPSVNAINGTGGRPEGTRAINGTGG